MTDKPDQPFSRRHGFSAAESEITVREDAPPGFRGALLQIAIEAGLSPSNIRSIACRVLRELPDPSNWSQYPNIWDEAQDLVLGCEWYRVYDITEVIAQSLQDDPERMDIFTDEINVYFKEKGIGWQLVGWEIRTRGNEAFESSIQVTDSLSEHPTAANEIREALTDMSRRPTPDLTGAIQHSMASLECVARDVCGDQRATLGDIIKRHPDLLPKPLDDALGKVWGWASETGRHLREGREPSREEAELVVAMSAAVATYLAKKTSQEGK